GCLHATMDLYKWAYKLSPAVPGELLADCFALAADVRELDIRASPYDLSAHGLSPVRIETPAGRAEYARAQAGFAAAAAPLRRRLLEVCAALLD
ncbi:MAG: 3-methyladenine DNA glycosylase, partial [Pseudonocardiales bacterium]|nr:3-methyladenine DNA glycosylase [Pseudonocardiales bacterium]